MTDIDANGVRSVAYPFVRETFSSYGEGDGEPTWRPGIRYEHLGPLPDSSPVGVADAIGIMELTIISIHKPGRRPTRVFYTRQWIDPNGKRFGKAALRVTTLSTFNRLLAGYRHPYELASPLPVSLPETTL